MRRWSACHPAEITDPGSGLVATLNTVTITSVAGLPPGMDLTFDDEDGVYEPASGQTAGCATLCGTPPFPGVFNIQLGILAIVTALGFEQEVTESFSLTLIIDPGAGGTSSFGFEPAAGCGAVWADFGATVFGEGNQITDSTRYQPLSTGNQTWPPANRVSASSPLKYHAHQG